MHDQWEEFQKNTFDGFDTTVAKVLELLEDFDKYQRTQEDDIYSQDYADEHRNGMKVISGG